MNRRDFTRGLAAFGAAPALPLSAAAKAAIVVPASATAEHMYFWGWFTARVHNKCSPDMLAQMLKLDMTAAEDIYRRLLANGAITAPDAMGISRAVEPIGNIFSRARKATAAAKRVLPDINPDAELSGHEPDAPDMPDPAPSDPADPHAEDQLAAAGAEQAGGADDLSAPDPGVRNG